MEAILERYEQYSYAERQSMGIMIQNTGITRGEDLDSLSLREFQSLEQQIDTALKSVRARKNQVMRDSISEMQKKHRALQEQNNQMSKKLKENEKQSQAVPNNQQSSSSTLILMAPTQAPPPPAPLPALTIGGAFPDRRAMDEDNEDQQGRAQTRPVSNTGMPPWMVHGLNQ